MLNIRAIYSLCVECRILQKKKKINKLPEQFQNPIEWNVSKKEEGKSIPIAHKYIIVHFPFIDTDTSVKNGSTRLTL